MLDEATGPRILHRMVHSYSHGDLVLQGHRSRCIAVAILSFHWIRFASISLRDNFSFSHGETWLAVLSIDLSRWCIFFKPRRKNDIV